MFTKKMITTLSIIGSLIVIVAAVWGFGNTFATNDRVDKVEMHSHEETEDLEIQIAGAFQNQQHKSSVTFWQFQIEILENELKEIRRQMRRYPEDNLLKEDYRDTLERKRTIQKKMEEAMQRIK